MASPAPPSSPPPGGDGVRVTPRRGRGTAPLLAFTGLLALGAGLAWLLWPAPPAGAPAPLPPETAAAPVRAPAPVASRPVEAPVELPSVDPDDLAVHFRPGDPEPTGAELITALHEAGVRTGLGAFNPPGTSPPLEGLAVPDDFELPEGYLRHHQSTDGGEGIEPILMFAPGAVFLDAQGRPITLPANGVVPPELAPPGLPIRWVRPARP